MAKGHAEICGTTAQTGQRKTCASSKTCTNDKACRAGQKDVQGNQNYPAEKAESVC